MKKKYLIIGIILLVLILTSIILFNNDAIRFKLSYEYINIVEYDNGKTIKVNIPLDNRIKYIKGRQVIDTFQNKTGIIYLGYNSCPWCRNIVEPLIEVAKEEKINTIYYVNIHDNLDDIKKELLQILDDYLRVDEDTNQKRLAVPDVYFVKNGKIISHHIGTIDSYKNPYEKMTSTQKEELKEIYRTGIEAIK